MVAVQDLERDALQQKVMLMFPDKVGKVQRECDY